MACRLKIEHWAMSQEIRGRRRNPLIFNNNTTPAVLTLTTTIISLKIVVD